MFSIISLCYLRKSQWYNNLLFLFKFKTFLEQFFGLKFSLKISPLPTHLRKKEEGV